MQREFGGWWSISSVGEWWGFHFCPQSKGEHWKDLGWKDLDCICILRSSPRRQLAATFSSLEISVLNTEEAREPDKQNRALKQRERWYECHVGVEVSTKSPRTMPCSYRMCRIYRVLLILLVVSPRIFLYILKFQNTKVCWLSKDKHCN